MNPNELNSMTLFDRVQYLEKNDSELTELGINSKQVRNSIDKYFTQDKLAGAVRREEESYIDLADYVAGYVRTQASIFPFTSVYTQKRDDEAIRLLKSLNFVGVSDLKNPRYLTGFQSEFRSSILGRLGIIGSGVLATIYGTQIANGENPSAVLLFAGASMGVIGAKLFYDVNKFLKTSAKEIEESARISEEFVRNLEY